MFEAGKASFDAISLSIEFLIAVALLFAVGFEKYDRDHGLDLVHAGLTITAFVGQHPDGFSTSKEIDGLGTSRGPGLQ